MVTNVTPEVRSDILNTISNTTVIWFRDVMKGFFHEPDSAFAKQVMLEAVAQAIIWMAANKPDGAALCQTYVYELQDFLNKVTYKEKR